MSTVRVMENFLWDDTVDITASSEDVEFPASNLRKQVRSKVWRSTSTTANVVFDLKTTEAIDSFAMVFRKNEVIAISDSAVVKLQANATDVWTSPSVDVTLTFDDDNSVFTHYFTSDQSYQFWRISIVDPGNPLGYVEISNVILSKAISLACPDNGFKWSISDQSEVVKTQFGQRYYNIRPNIRDLNVTVPLVEDTVMESLADLYERVGTAEVVGVVIDPEGNVFNENRFFIYGNLNNRFEPPHKFFNLFDLVISVQEML